VVEPVDIGPFQEITEVHWTDARLFAVIECYATDAGNAERHKIMPSGVEVLHQYNWNAFPFLPNASDPQRGPLDNPPNYEGGTTRETYTPPVVFPPSKEMINGIEGEEFAGYRAWAEPLAAGFAGEEFGYNQSIFCSIFNLKKITGDVERPDGIITIRITFDNYAAGQHTDRITCRLFTHAKFRKTGTELDPGITPGFIGTNHYGPLVLQNFDEPEPIFETFQFSATPADDRVPLTQTDITINMTEKTASIPPLL